MFYLNVEGAVYRDDKWLIIKRSMKEAHAGGLLSLVGGTVENAQYEIDVLEQTLRRELFEEVGIKVKSSMQYVKNSSFSLDSGNEVLNVVFLCECMEGEAYVKSEEEVDSVYWMTTAEVLQHRDAPVWLIDSIKEADKRRHV